MSRMKLLLDVIEDIRSLANSLQAVATALGQNALEDAAAPGFLGHADLQSVSHDLFLSERQVLWTPFTGRPQER